MSTADVSSTVGGSIFTSLSGTFAKTAGTTSSRRRTRLARISQTARSAGVCVVVTLIAVLVALAGGGTCIYLSYSIGVSTYSGQLQTSALGLSEMISSHVAQAVSAVNSIVDSPVVVSVSCEGMGANVNTTEHAKSFLRSASEGLTEVWPHHVRLIDSLGIELIRIDLEHDQTAQISTLLHDVSDRYYQDLFASGDCRLAACVTKWSTHGPIGDSTAYTYVGNDPDGDHQSDHVEFFPLPSLIKIVRDVRCKKKLMTPDATTGSLYADDESIPSPAYLVFNLRMVKLLNTMEARVAEHASNHIIVLSEDGDYLFNSVDRTVEFETDTGKEQTFGVKWGDGFHRTLFGPGSDGAGVVRHSVKMSHFFCSPVSLGTESYRLCAIISRWRSFMMAPTPLVVGLAFTLLLVILLSLFILWRRFTIVKSNKRVRTLMQVLYPKAVCEKLMLGSPVLPKVEKELGIHFADIVGSCKLSDCLTPFALVHYLGSCMFVIEMLASQWGIYRVKTIGDAVFNVSNINGRMSTQKHLCSLLDFAFAIRHFFTTHQIQIPEIPREIMQQADLDDEVQEESHQEAMRCRRTSLRRRMRAINEQLYLINPSKKAKKNSPKSDLEKLVVMREMDCPTFRQGLHVGSATSGVFQQGSPVFDLWGREINYGSRMESTSRPNRIQVSHAFLNKIKDITMYEIAKVRQVPVKGFGTVPAYWMEIRDSRRFHREMEQLYNELGIAKKTTFCPKLALPVFTDEDDFADPSSSSCSSSSSPPPEILVTAPGPRSAPTLNVPAYRPTVDPPPEIPVVRPRKKVVFAAETGPSQIVSSASIGGNDPFDDEQTPPVEVVVAGEQKDGENSSVRSVSGESSSHVVSMGWDVQDD